MRNGLDLSRLRKLSAATLERAAEEVNLDRNSGLENPRQTGLFSNGPRINSMRSRTALYLELRTGKKTLSQNRQNG